MSVQRIVNKARTWWRHGKDGATFAKSMRDRRVQGPRRNSERYGSVREMMEDRNAKNKAR